MINYPFILNFCCWVTTFYDQFNVNQIILLIKKTKPNVIFFFEQGLQNL